MPPGVVFLQREHAQLLRAERPNGADGGGGAGERGDARHPEHRRDAPHGQVVEERLPPQRRVDHQVELPVEQPVSDVGTALVDLEHHVGLQVMRPEVGGGAARRDQCKPEPGQIAGDRERVRLVVVVHADECPAGVGEPLAGCQLRLGERRTEARRAAHHLPGRLHLGAQNRVDAGKADEREHRGLDEDSRHVQVVDQAELDQAPADHHAGRRLGQWHAGRLGEIRHGARRARVHLEDVDGVVLDGELNVQQPDHLERPRHAAGVVADDRQVPLRHEVRRHDAGAVPGVDAGLLDMLHDAADHHGAARIGHRVDVKLECVLQELVDEDGMLGRRVHGLGHVAVERAGVIDDGHRPPAQDVRRPHHDRIADGTRRAARFRARRGDAARRLRNPQVPEQPREPLAVLGQIDRVGRRADDVHPGRLQLQRQLQRRLPAKLHDARDRAAGRLLAGDDRVDILARQRLEVQPVDRVVVRGDRLGVAVDHDRLIPLLPQRERRVAAAVVELDPLPDTVGPAAQDDDLAPVRRLGFALLLVRAVEVWRERGELGCARIDPLVGGPQLFVLAPCGDRGRLHADDARHLLVAESAALEHRQQVGRHLPPADHPGRAPQLFELRELRQEPAVDVGRLMELLYGPAALQRPENRPHPAVVRRDELLPQPALIIIVRTGLPEDQPLAAHFQRAHRLQEGFLERAADRHHLADRLHLRRQRAVGLRKLLERPARDLHDHVVDGRLEGGRRQARDVVRDLLQAVAQRQLRRNLGDRESGCLRCQSRRTGDARIHLDRHHPAVFGIHGELDVGPAGLDADAPDDSARGIPHPLVLLVGQRERRRDRDAVAGVHAHRVDVLDRADHDEVVRHVAHHLELEFLPADHRLLDQDFVDRTELDAAVHQFAELLDVVGDAAAHAPQRERGPDDHGKTEPLDAGVRLLDGARILAGRHLDADRGHRLAELEPVFRNLDGVDRGADELHVEFVQHAALGQLHRQVQGGLPADRGQQGVGPFALDDGARHLDGERLHVGAVGHLRIGHDRGGIAVDQHHLEPFGPQRLARLRAGVVELARLPDHDRSRSDDQNPLDVGSPWHTRERC